MCNERFIQKIQLINPKPLERHSHRKLPDPIILVHYSYECSTHLSASFHKKPFYLMKQIHSYLIPAFRITIILFLTSDLTLVYIYKNGHNTHAFTLNLPKENLN